MVVIEMNILMHSYLHITKLENYFVGTYEICVFNRVVSQQPSYSLLNRGKIILNMDAPLIERTGVVDMCSEATFVDKGIIFFKKSSE